MPICKNCGRVVQEYPHTLYWLFWWMPHAKRYVWAHSHDDSVYCKLTIAEPLLEGEHKDGR